MMKHKDQRVAVFVDAQNMYHSAKNLYGANVNFKAVLDAAVAGRLLVRAMVYGIASPGGDEAKFLEALEKQGFELKIKDLQVFAGGAKKGDWDVGMAIDAVKLAEKVDVIVLMTGDGDFCPVIEYLHGHGVMVEVVAFGESTNAELRAMADSFVDLSTSRANLLRAGSKKAQPDLEPTAPASDTGSTRGVRSVKVTY